MEYELSATRFDLRFVPEEMEFGEATSSATGPPDPEKYKPKERERDKYTEYRTVVAWSFFVAGYSTYSTVYREPVLSRR